MKPIGRRGFKRRLPFAASRSGSGLFARLGIGVVGLAAIRLLDARVSHIRPARGGSQSGAKGVARTLRAHQGFGVQAARPHDLFAAVPR